MVTAARKSFFLVHAEFCLHLHTFLSAIRNQADGFGEEGFASLLAGLNEGADAAAAFHTLIGLYNDSIAKTLKKVEVEAGDDEDEDADGEPEVPSPEARQASEIAGEDSDGEAGAGPPPPPPKKSPKRTRRRRPRRLRRVRL
jgi:hypothetical protein